MIIYDVNRVFVSLTVPNIYLKSLRILKEIIWHVRSESALVTRKMVYFFLSLVQNITTPLCKSLPFQGKTVLMSSKYSPVMAPFYYKLCCKWFPEQAHKGFTIYCGTEIVSAGKSNLCVFQRIFCLSLRQITTLKWKIL